MNFHHDQNGSLKSDEKRAREGLSLPGALWGSTQRSSEHVRTVLAMCSVCSLRDKGTSSLLQKEKLHFRARELK